VAAGDRSQIRLIGAAYQLTAVSSYTARERSFNQLTSHTDLSATLWV
jgi:hypothetical protein